MPTSLGRGQAPQRHKPQTSTSVPTGNLRGHCGWPTIFLPILVGERQGGGFRKNPDYLIFSERPLGHPKDPALNKMVCELKSGETGAESAHRHVQLGILMARYLISIAAYARGQSKPPVIACCGLIASPTPTNLVPKGRTKPGRGLSYSERDPILGVEFYRIPCGEELHLESFEYYSL